MLTPVGLQCDHCGATVLMNQSRIGWHTVGEPAPLEHPGKFIARVTALIEREHFEAYRTPAVSLPHVLHFCSDSCFRDWWELAIEGRLAQQKEEADRCQLCGHTYGGAELHDGRLVGPVVPLSHDHRFCQSCASGAAYREMCDRQAETFREFKARRAAERAQQAEAYRLERAARGDR